MHGGSAGRMNFGLHNRQGSNLDDLLRREEEEKTKSFYWKSFKIKILNKILNIP